MRASFNFIWISSTQLSRSLPSIHWLTWHGWTDGRPKVHSPVLCPINVPPAPTDTHVRTPPNSISCTGDRKWHAGHCPSIYGSPLPNTHIQHWLDEEAPRRYPISLAQDITTCPFDRRASSRERRKIRNTMHNGEVKADQGWATDTSKIDQVSQVIRPRPPLWVVGL